MRKLHLGFLVGFMTLLALCVGGTYLLHRVQMGRNASSLLDRARSAEAGGNLQRAEESLGQYLGLKRDDSAAWTWYARITDERTKEKRGRERVFLVNEEALRKNPDDRNLERRCAALAIELERHNDARRHLIHLNDAIQADPDKATEAAELEDLLGQCDQPESKFDEAERHYRKSIALDSTRVVTFDRLARLSRKDMKNPEAADRAIEEMLKANPKSALAHVNRWRYHREFGPAADGNDIALALKFGPDEAEVLIAAAELARQSKDLVGARKHIDRGLDRHPENAGFYQLAAELEMAENHADRAEAVLRRGIAAVPSNVLFKVLLAETLIVENKLDGEEGAISWIERLRRLGLADGYAQYLDGRVSMAKQRWDGAIKSLESARALLVADTTITPRINLMLADCYRRARSGGDWLIVALQGAAEGETAAAVVRPLLAEELERAGRLDEAIAVHLQIVDSRPGSRLDLVRLLILKNARLPQGQRRWQEAEQRLRDAARMLPDATEDLTLLRAELSGAEGKADEARKVLEAAIQASPRSVRYRSALAAILLGDNHPDQALKVLDQAEKDLGTSASLLRGRVAYWLSRGGDEAKAALGRLAEAQDRIPAADRPALLNELATACYRLGDRVRAAQLLRELAKLQPDNLETLGRLASLALAAGDPSVVQEIADQIKQVEGQRGTLWRYVEAAQLIQQAAMTEPAQQESIRAKASGLTDEILAIRPDWWAALMLRGQLAELAGKPGDAVTSYLRAIDLGATEPELARRLFALLYQRQEFDQIDQFVKKLDERGAAPDELKLATAVNAMRRNDIQRAIDLAREVLPETSSNASDLLFLSKMLLQAGRIDEVEKPLKRARELAPGMPDVWITEVQFLINAGRRGEIAGVLEQAVRSLSEDQVTRTLALCQSLAGNDDEAASLFQTELDRQPGDVATLRLVAEFYIKVSRLDKAKPLIDRLLDPLTKAPPADVAWARRAQALGKMRSGNPQQIDEALSLIDQNLKTNPESFEDRRSRAILLSMKPKRRDEAIRSLSELNATGLLSRADRFLLAQLHARNRQSTQCRDVMLALLSGPNPDPDHVLYYVSSLIDQNDLGQAERWLRELKTVDADLPRVRAATELKARLQNARKQEVDLVALLKGFSTRHPDQAGAAAELFERYHRPKEAEAGYRAFAAQNVNEPLRALALAGFLGRQNRVEEALALCEQARKTCPAEPVVTTSVAILAAGKNVTDEQRQRVESWLEETVRRQSNSTPVRLSLARQRSMERRYDQSVSIYREVLGSNPNNVEVLNNLSWLLAFETGKEQEALDLINQAIEIAGSDATLLDTRAVVYLKQGKIDLALQDLHAAVELNPEKSILYFHLARALQMDSNEAEARAALQEADQRGLKPENVDPREQEIFREVRRSLARS